MGRGVSRQTRAIVDRAVELWATVYQPANITPTVRQLFYALAVEEYVPKSEKGYSKVQRVLADARERGEYPWEGIHDSLRKVQRTSAWPCLADFFTTVRKAYKRDYWQDQPRQVEVWVEKDTIHGTVEPLTRQFQVPLLVARGYLSVSAKNEASQRLADKARTLIYIGDHDPSGVNMLEQAAEWIRDRSADGVDLEIERIAITDEDHANPDLPHLPINTNDSRAMDYLARFGAGVVEVEALSPVDLQQRLRAALERHIEPDAWLEATVQEGEDQDKLRALLARAEAR